MKNKKAFTLVELIVVMVLLTILGTIGFLSYTNYNKGARNTVRTVDVGTVERALKLHLIEVGHYPEPDNFIGIYNADILIWKQGTIGKKVITQLSTVSKIPLDPLFYTNYTYSVSYDNQIYQIGFLKE